MNPAPASTDSLTSRASWLTLAKTIGFVFQHSAPLVGGSPHGSRPSRRLQASVLDCKHGSGCASSWLRHERILFPATGAREPARSSFEHTAGPDLNWAARLRSSLV